VEQDVLFALTDKIIQKDPRGALQLFNEIIDDGKDPGVFLSNLIEHFRNLMVAKVSKADAKLVDLPQEVCDRLLKQSESLSLEEIFTVFNILVTTQEMAKRLDSQRIPLEISLVRLAYNRLESRGVASVSQSHRLESRGVASLSQSHRLEKPAVSSAPAEERLKKPALEKEKQGDAEETLKNDASAQTPAGQERASVSLDQVKSVWSNIVNNLAHIKMSVSTYLSEGEPAKLQGNILTIAFPNNYSLHKESLDKKENKAMVEKAVSELCNADLRINFILVAQAKHDQGAHSNPFIKSTLEMFGGRVVKEG
jgi:DNA polymerase III subunit gamma/tau